VAEALLVAAGVLLVSRVVLPAHGRSPAETASSVRRELAEGFRWTIHHPAVRTLALTILIFKITGRKTSCKIELVRSTWSMGSG
jgi:hypothetical protein